MTPDDLARREHTNFIEMGAAALAGVDGAVIERQEGVVLLATGLPMRLFNQVIIEGDDASPDVVEAAVAVTRDRGDRFVLNLRIGTDDRYVPIAERSGLVPLSVRPWLPGMALYPIDVVREPALAGLEIRHVRSVDGIEDHVRAASEGFEMPEAIARQLVAPSLLGRDDVTVYVGYANGEPVTSGLGCRTGDTVGVYNIATVPAARGRGYGAAMTARIVADGASAGCDVAILQASDMGYAIYERMGFRTVVEYMGYVDPASLDRDD